MQKQAKFKNKVNRFVPVAALRTMYNTLVYPYLIYGIIVRECTYKSKHCKNEYLSGNSDSSEYVSELSSSNNFSVAECFPEKLKWPWDEQVCQGVKCKAL